MHIIAIALIISILALVASFAFVGIIPSIAALVLNIVCISKEKSINTVRALAISVVGVLLPIIMYLNSYGLHLPYEKTQNVGFLTQILYDNYSKLGFDMSGLIAGKISATDVVTSGDSEMYYVSEGVAFDDEGVHLSDATEQNPGNIKYDINGNPITGDDKANEGSLDDFDAYAEESYDDAVIFEAIDSNEDTWKLEVGRSDDDMPSYGGLPIGTIIIGQYFREDDHNCNPILVLQNKTGKECRFECIFTARDEEGNELAVSEKTVEVVKNDALFVFEGRFDKTELGGKIPDMYEFLVSKRDPYERNMYDEVTVIGQKNNYSVILVAQNLSDKKAKVDAYVLFFDGDELVDCIWMIPRNGEDVCVNPGSSAAIRADAYYKFDRIETYYTAYEAKGGE